MAESDAEAGGRAPDDSLPADPVALSAAYLRAVRTGEDTDDHRTALRRYDPADLATDLGDDRGRKAFWINVYNAVVQETLDQRPDLYESRRTFFGTDLVRVAGETLSLDDVEHGILRRSQVSVGLGYVRRPNLLVDPFERRMRVEQLDERIHFALNCGAASCPPIAAYTCEGIDEELDLATRSYFETDVEYDPDAGKVWVPRLLLWYRGDFGGRSGIYRLLREYEAIPADAKPKVKYSDYDWSLSLGEFRDR